MKLSKEEDYYIIDDKKIISSKDSKFNSKFGNTTLNICGIKYFAKNIRLKTDCELLAPTEIGSTRMYNDLGIITPPANIVENPKIADKVYLATQDVESIKDYTTTIASKSKLAKIINDLHLSFIGDKQWNLLYNNVIQEKFLSCMTPQCFERLISLFLLDEIRTEGDRHLDNYFLIKKKGSRKYEDILPIDNEFAEVSYRKIKTKEAFKSFATTDYLSSTPTNGYCTENFLERTNSLKQLLHDGKLTPAQVNLIKKELQYDLPKTIREGSKHPQLIKSCQDASDCMSRIWDYHYSKDGVAHELGL